MGLRSYETMQSAVYERSPVRRQGSQCLQKFDRQQSRNMAYRYTSNDLTTNPPSVLYFRLRHARLVNTKLVLPPPKDYAILSESLPPSTVHRTAGDIPHDPQHAHRTTSRSPPTRSPSPRFRSLLARYMSLSTIPATN
jgi:hypothetical protein